MRFDRLARRGVWLLLPVALMVLVFVGVDSGSPVYGLVSFARVVLIVLAVIVVAVLLAAVFLRPFRVWLINRFRKGKGRGPGLSKEQRDNLSKGEARAFKSMREPWRWAESAGVAVTARLHDGSTGTYYPRVHATGVSAFGPFVDVVVPPGKHPGHFEDDAVSAALGLPIRAEKVGPASARLQLLSRDPLAGTRRVQTGSAPAASSVRLEDWTDEPREDVL